MTVVLTALLTLGSPDIDFFEKRIRPVLVEHCHECHSAAARSPKGGLLLDSRAGIRRGGDSGPAVVPGDPGASLILAALRHDGPEMPPSGRLPDSVVADFERWIALGAPDPREQIASGGAARAPGAGIDLPAGREFWAFRAPQRSPLPAVRDRSWPAGWIDRFVLAALEARGIEPSPPARPEQLVRRLFFDLVGLPPSPADVDAFVADPSERAWAELVDRLLASPHFGERWGRHWLDVARYADSTGGGRTRALDDAWRYRDWVIDSFNADRPYDEFVRAQIAGDLLPSSTRDERWGRLVATSFLVLGPNNYENQDKDLLQMDVVDEQIDATGRAFLAMSLGCARCHDHKFDPIPTADYYALAGIFRSTKTLTPGNVSGFVTRPLPLPSDEQKRVDEHLERVALLEKELKAAKADVKRVQKKLDALVAAAIPDDAVLVDDAEATTVGEWKRSTFHPRFIGAGYIHDDRKGKGEKSVTFEPELPAEGVYDVLLASTPGTNRDVSVPVTVRHAEGELIVKVDQRPEPPIRGQFISLGRFRFGKGRGASVTVSNLGTTGHVIADAVQFIPVDRERGAVGAESEASAQRESLQKRLKEAKDLAAAAEKTLAREKKAAPPRPTTMSVVDEKEPADCPIHLRGQIRQHGEVVERGFLSVISPGRPEIAAEESGRRELAAWLASAENPLTSRVLVNRVWHWLLGAGIVRTVDNFGLTGERPSHPQLLDMLALRFDDRGRSVKEIVREIVLSRTYRQASAPRAGPARIDPENRLLWRAARRRLDAESTRDAMLVISDSIDWRAGGPSIDPAGKGDGGKIEYGYRYTTRRRSVYVPIFRNGLLDVFDVFDFADPNLPTGRRAVTTRPTQALWLLNNPFVAEQATRFARRILDEPASGDGERLERACRLALGRSPRPAEREAALEYLAAAADNRLAAWTEVCRTLFACVDFRYLE